MIATSAMSAIMILFSITVDAAAVVVVVAAAAAAAAAATAAPVVILSTPITAQCYGSGLAKREKLQQFMRAFPKA